MQIYAYDKEGEETMAHFAKQGSSYFCFECHEGLRVRSGPFIRPHFFHFKQSSPCRLSQKSATHLEIQNKLLKILPHGEAAMEKRFPSLNRIADIAWEKEKLIFEVQVSFITSEEIADRSLAYRTLGYEIVWILHDHRFNNYRITAAEHSLLDHPHYFTNISADGSGGFFDQFSYHLGGTRAARLFRREVNLARPQRHNALPALPARILSHRKNWRISFQGDLLNSTHLSIRHLEKASEIEALRPKRFVRYSWKKKIKDFFRLIGYLILDSATR